MENPQKPNFTGQMHNIVWICLGLFTLLALTFPLAMWRVSRMENFEGSHVKSFPLEGKVGKLKPIADK